MENNLFHNPTKGGVALSKLVWEIKAFICQDPDAEYRLVIGSDSANHKVESGDQTNFVSAIVIHRVGSGGRFFWQRLKKKRTYSLREKIYTETLLSLDLAQKLVPKLKETLVNGKDYKLEIHIDVGQAGATRDMIKEVVGMVSGNGFEVKTKPEAYGAFVVADRYT